MVFASLLLMRAIAGHKTNIPSDLAWRTQLSKQHTSIRAKSSVIVSIILPNNDSPPLYQKTNNSQIIVVVVFWQPCPLHLPHKMAHDDINKPSKNAAADELANVALTAHELNALIKIQQFIHSLPRNTDRHHLDWKAVKLLVKEITELNKWIKVLDECQKGRLKEKSTLQGGHHCG